jgi:hypothetical protein
VRCFSNFKNSPNIIGAKQAFINGKNYSDESSLADTATVSTALRRKMGCPCLL